MNGEGKNVTVIDQHVVNLTDSDTPYYIRSQCNFYRGSLPNSQGVFFALSLGAELIFDKAEIDNIRVQAQNFISASGNNYIGFLNTSIVRMDFAQSFIGESANATDPVVVEFNGAYVTGLNRDHPYSLLYGVDAGLLNLHSTNKDIVYIRNSVFEYNFMLVSNAPNNQFMYAVVTNLEITDSVFRACMGGFYFLLDSENSVQTNIRNATFDSNLCDFHSILTLHQYSGNRYLLFENVTFINNVSHKNGILRVGTDSSTFATELNLTIVNINLTNNELVSSTFGLVFLDSLTSVEIEACTISENLIFRPDFPYDLFTYMLENGLINDSLELQEKEYNEGVPFVSQVQIDAVNAIRIVNFQLYNSEYASEYGLKVNIATDFSGVFTISDSDFFSFGSTELYVTSSHTSKTPPVVYITNCDFAGPNTGGVSVVFQPNSGGGMIVTASRFFYNGSLGLISSGIRMDGWFMNVTDCVFEGNRGSNGGAVMVTLIGNDTPVLDEYLRMIFIANSQFRNEVSSLKGGDIYLERDLGMFPLKIHIENCTFINSTSLNSGGFLSFDHLTLTSVLIDNCTFASGSTSTGGMIQAADVSGAITIRNSNFLDILAPTGYIILLESMRNTSLTLSNNDISECSFRAGVYISISPKMRVDSVSNRYKSNIGIVIWNDQGSFSDSDSVFYNNSNRYSPCYYQDKEVAKAEFVGTVFSYNWATDTIGAVMISAGSTASFKSCRFEGNSAGNMTGVMQVEMGSSVTISACEFLYNWAISASTLYLLDITDTNPLYLSDSVFIGNTGNGLLQMSNSNMDVQNVTIMKSQSSYIAGLILIQSNLSIFSSSITQMNGTLGCVLYGVLDSNVAITNSIVSDISCEQESLLCLSDLYSEFSIRESSLVRMSVMSASVINFKNSGKVSFDSVQLTNIESPLAVFSLWGVNVSVVHSLFINTNCLVILAEQSTLLVNDSVFENVTAFTAVGGINCTNCGSVGLSEVIFMNVSATNTGGMSVTESNSVSIAKCRFAGLVSGTYGALAVQSDSLNLTDSSFIHNQATGSDSYGGAAYLSTRNSSYLSGNVFSENSATTGGALFFPSAQPVNTSNMFEGNSAVYGSDVSSYAINMRLVNDSIPIATSGQVFSDLIYVELLDHYGQVVKTDNSSIASISSNSSLVGNLKGTAYQGVFNFSQFTITDTPNSNVTLTISGSRLSLAVSFYLRHCIQGEILSEKVCVLCKPDTYSVTAGATNCTTCLPHADCPGNSIPYPRPGFWRPAEWYDGIFECPLASACLGSANYTNSTGICATGYTGNMCQSCAGNHTRDGKDMCTPCLSGDTYIIGQVFLGSGILVFLVLLLLASIASATTETNKSGVLLKMLLNYLHFTVLVAHFNMLWPDELQGMFKIFEYLGNSGEQFILWECSGSELYFREIIIIAVLPAVLILVHLLLLIASRCMCWTQKTVSNFLCSLTISLIFVHPLVVRVAFSAFRCITIKPNELWLRFELNKSCWDATHSLYALAAALPTLILWAFGPLFLISIIFIKYRKQLPEEVELRRYLSFLCMGYQPTFFYWELVNICMKNLVIILYVFMSSEHISVQALTLSAVLWVSAAIFKYEAFEGRAFASAELRGIWIAIITTYCGAWFSSEAISYSAEMVLFTLILVSHAYYLILWSILLIRTLWLPIIKTYPRVGRLCPRFQYITTITQTQPSPAVNIE